VVHEVIRRTPEGAAEVSVAVRRTGPLRGARTCPAPAARPRFCGFALPALALACLALAAAPARAADDADLPGLSTDRPDFTETTTVIERAVMQIEGGFTYEAEGVSSVYGFPEILLRTGVVNRLEVRLGLPDYERIDVGGEPDHKLGDGYMGAKVQLSPSGGPWGVGLIPGVKVPLDREDKAKPTPEAVLAWSLDFPDDWSVGGGFGHTWLKTSKRGPNAAFSTFVLSRPLGERAGAFFEWMGEFQDGVPGKHLIHHGYTWTVQHDLQIDVHGGVGLTEANADFFVGAGFAWKP